MIYTAEHFLGSEKFMAIAIEDAIKMVATKNNQTVEATIKAFSMQVPNVIKNVAKLVKAAADHCAEEANAGRLWK